MASSGTTEPLSVEIIQDWAQIETLVPQWRKLLERSSANSIFLTPEWVMAWRGAMQGLNIQPVVVLVANACSEMVGLALYHLSTQRLFSLLPYRVLRPMSDYASGAVYHDVMADPAAAPQIYDKVLDALAGFDCDAVWLPHVAHWTGARDRFEAAAQKAGFDIIERSGEFSCIELPATYSDYEQMLSASTRKDLRRTSTRLFERESASIKDCANCPTFPAAFESYVEMNTRRWKAIAQAGVFERKPREADFYRLFAPVALQRGWLRFLQLETGDKAVAMEIGYRYGDRYYAVQGSYDVDGPPGAGKVLLLEMLKQELNSGAREFDLLSGTAAYKDRYAAGGRPISEFFLLKRSTKNLPLRVGRPWPRGRYLDFTKPPGI